MDRLRGCINRTVRKVADDKTVQTYRALYAEQFGLFVHLATKSKQTRGSQQMLERVLLNGLRQLEERILTVLLDRSKDRSTEGSRVSQLQNKLLYCEDFLMQKFRNELYCDDVTNPSQADDMSPFLVPIVSESRRGQILRGALQVHEKDLVSVLDMDSTHLLEFLAKESLLTESDEDDIKSGSTKTERNRRILRVLSTSPPAKTESSFMAFLKEHHGDQAKKFQQTMNSLQTKPLSQMCAACAVRSEIDLGRVAKTLFKRRAIKRGEYLTLCNPSLSSEDKWKVVAEGQLEEAVINALVPKFQHYHDRLRGVKDLECRCDEMSEAPSTGSDYLSLCDDMDLFGNTNLPVSSSGEHSCPISSGQCSRSSSFQNQSEKDERSEVGKADYDALKEKLSDLCSKVNSILEYNSAKTRCCRADSTVQMSCCLNRACSVSSVESGKSATSDAQRHLGASAEDAGKCVHNVHQRSSPFPLEQESDLKKSPKNQLSSHQRSSAVSAPDHKAHDSDRTTDQRHSVHFQSTDIVHRVWPCTDSPEPEASKYQTWI